MNDRMQIAKDMMREMLRINNEIHYEDAAAEAVRYADALLKALAESEAERPQFNTSDDQRTVVNLTGGDFEFLSPQPSPQWWGAVPGDGPAQSTGAHDEVGDWRGYVKPTDGKRALMHVAAGNMRYVGDAFCWMLTPQGFRFWRDIATSNASALTITRARDFARRVLEAMEAEGE